MNLSNSGRVVIIDDQYDDIEPLINIFGKNGIPFLYFDGEVENLPSNPVDGVRFIFLDIEMQDTVGQSSKNKASKIIQILNRILSPKNGPFVIIFWSRHKEDIDQVVENCANCSISPVSYMVLEKAELLDYKLNDISDEIEKCLKDIGAFQLYVEWENLLNKASKAFVHDFSSLVNDDSDWSENTSTLFYKLYKSYVGKNELPSPIEKYRCACTLMNRSFHDTLQNYTASQSQLPSDFVLENGTIDIATKAKLNSYLFTSQNFLPSVSTGYAYLENSEELEQMLGESLFKEGKIPDKCSLCKIILTPSCDLAQNKVLKIKKTQDGSETQYNIHRVVYGLLFPVTDDIQQNRKKSDAQFDVGTIWHEEKAQLLILHFSTLTSLDERRLVDDPIFALKRDLMFDLQSKAANHINRLGNFQLS